MVKRRVVGKNANNIVMRSKGKEFNQISNEAIKVYEQWLKVSELAEETLMDGLAEHDVKIAVCDNSQNAQIFLFAGSDVMGEPFTFIKNNVLSAEDMQIRNFFADVAVVIMLIASRSGNGEVYEKLRKEVSLKILPFIDK